jgi:general L-amino acid transport system substrate-binding protein
MSWDRFILCLVFVCCSLCGNVHAGTLKTVKDRGSVVCGVSNNVPGFAFVDENGEWTGFDVDFCRAIAAAVFGDISKARVVQVSPNERLEALKAKKIDVLVSNTTWTLSRETANNVIFTGTTYYDGQGFMVPKDRKLVSPLQIDGSKVCLESGTTSELNFVDFAEINNIKYEAVRAPQFMNLVKAYEAGQCNVLTSDISQLYAQKLLLGKPGDHMIFADVISQEPLGPAVRQDDPQWFNIVKWVNFAMLNAEALSLSKTNIDTAKDAHRPPIRRFVGTEGDFGKQLGLSADWALNIVKLVGNYGEVLERNLGQKSVLGVRRGMNNLWKFGGIQYAPPIR